MGEIVALAGMEGIEIGEPITSADDTRARCTLIAVDEPDHLDDLRVNNSPSPARKGSTLRRAILWSASIGVCSRTSHPRRADRVARPVQGFRTWRVAARILIEMMRREGYISVSKS